LLADVGKPVVAAGTFADHGERLAGADDELDQMVPR